MNDQTDQTGAAQDQGAPEPAPSVPAKIERVPARLEAQREGVLPIIPRDIEEAQRYTNGLIAANQVPDAFRVDGKKANPPNGPLVLMGVLKSMEVGLPPQTGLEVLLPLNGRFTVWGDGVIGLIQQSGKVKSYMERAIGPGFDFNATPLGEWPDDFGFEVRVSRVGQDEPYIGRFTVGDAKRQGLWMNSYKKPWIQSPLRMLKIRARSFAVRDGFADCLMGLAIKEEVEDTLPDVVDGGELASPVKRLSSLLDDEPEETPAEPPQDAQEDASEDSAAPSDPPPPEGAGEAPSGPDGSLPL